MNSKGDRSISFNQALVLSGLSVLTGMGISYVINKYFVKEKEGTNNIRKKRLIEKKTTVVLQQEATAHRLKVEASLGKKNTLLSELQFLEGPTCDIERIPHLASIMEVTEFPRIVTPLLGDSKYRSIFGGEGFIPEEAFVCENSFILSRSVFGPKNPISDVKKYLRAGPRKFIYFEPDEVTACIVTCGGLCPGLNVVIREIYNCLTYNYKVKKVYGIRYGYKGFYSYDWEELNSDKMRGIHNLGGTILGSSRGGFNLEKIMNALIEKKVNQVYCIGGDGTHRGINELFKEIARRKLKITIVGIPKTIDNDIPVIDKSFGFETAVEEAQRAIQSANVEASCAEYGLGLVKLMGRNAGFIAMYASLANRDVNICLVPEFPFELGGPRGLLEFVARRLRHKRHCVMVVAEGAGTAIIDGDVGEVGKDASGNVKLGDVGVYLKNKITDYCAKNNIDLTLKYIDPTYMIRTVPANSLDKQICSQLAQNAVHGAMSGFTGFTIGNVGNRTCMIPLSEITNPSKPNTIQSNDRAWQRLLASTGQPSFLNDEDAEGEKAMCKVYV